MRLPLEKEFIDMIGWKKAISSLWDTEFSGFLEVFLLLLPENPITGCQGAHPRSLKLPEADPSTLERPESY